MRAKSPALERDAVAVEEAGGWGRVSAAPAQFGCDVLMAM